MDLSGKSYKAFIDREEALKSNTARKMLRNNTQKGSLLLTNESTCFSTQVVLKKLMPLLLRQVNQLNLVRLKEHTEMVL
jgi:hypothetical protein